MSKILNVTPITDAARFPIKKGTLQFLQDAHKDSLAHTLIGLIGAGYDGLTPYVLYGCENSGSGLSYNITGGAIFFLGELYGVDAAAFTSPGGQVAVLNVAVTQYTTDADPVTFTDASIKNVHNIRAIAIQSGVAGSGTTTKNYSDCVFLSNLTTLEAGLATVNSAWATRNDTTDVTFTGGTAVVCTVSRLKYKIIGKTVHLTYFLNITNTAQPSFIKILIPEGKTAVSVGDLLSVDAYTYTFIDGVSASVVGIYGADLTHIGIATSGLTAGSGVTISGQITFEIA